MEKLYKEYSRLVFNYLNSLCGNFELAEELTQETFYKAIKGINKFNNECKISIDNDFYFEDLIVEKSLDDNVTEKSELINLYKHIHELDENTREVFYLRIKGELSFKDIGEILNKSESWAKLAFYRGKIKLKEAMKHE